jgi:hypothetical protein
MLSKIRVILVVSTGLLADLETQRYLVSLKFQNIVDLKLCMSQLPKIVLSLPELWIGHLPEQNPSQHLPEHQYKHHFLLGLAGKEKQPQEWLLTRAWFE